MGLEQLSSDIPAIPWDDSDDPVMAEFLATGFFPPSLPSKIAVKGHGQPFLLATEDIFSLVSARGRLHRWLCSQIQTPAYRSLGIIAKRAFLRDEYDRTDREAITGLYSNPSFRERLNQIKKQAHDHAHAQAQRPSP